MNTEIKQYGTTEALLFLNGKGVDGNGRYISEYFDFDHDKWEECHNHVQWAFPSHIASRFNINAPVVHDMNEFAMAMTVNALQNSMRLMRAYLESLGFVETDDYQYFDPTSDRLHLWLSPYNHNYQRITRLLNFLYYVDFDMCQHVFGEFLRAAEYALSSDWSPPTNFLKASTITPETLLFWSKASIGKL